MHDWNWFFTSISQSAAAIVGILGGFIISKILNRETDFNNNTMLIDQLEQKVADQKRKISIRDFEWYNNQVRIAVMESREYDGLVRSGKEGAGTEELYTAMRFSPYDSESEILDMYRNDCSAQKPGYIGFLKNLKFESAVLSGQKESKQENERELLDTAFVSTKALIDEIEKALRKIGNFPKEDSLIKRTLYAVTIMFLAGVIFPLTFTPCSAETDYAAGLTPELVQTYLNSLFSIKDVLLCIVALSFMYIIITFLKKTMTMSIPQKRLDDLRKETVLGHYSPYFVNYERNRVHTHWAD